MPRIADQHLEERILRTAQRLWRDRGDIGLTLRTIAREAGTTTTTVYKRFRNKEALRFAMAQQIYQQLSGEIISSPTLEDIHRRYLRLAERHPREYRLLFGPIWTKILGSGSDRPVKKWLLAELAKRFGGKPEAYEQAYYAFFLTVHGAASLLTSTHDSPGNVEMRKNCIAVCDTFLKNIGIFRNRG